MWFQHYFRTVMVLLLLLLATAAPSPAEAQIGPVDGQIGEVRSHCWASGSLAESMVAVARDAGRWYCAGQPYSIHDERIYLRFAIAEGQVAPIYLLSRRSALDAIHFLLIMQDGQFRHMKTTPDQWQNSKADGAFRVSLPRMDRQARHVIVVFDRPSHLMVLEQAYLAAADPADSEQYNRKLILLAGLCGMLAIPLVFNAAFYWVLREPFVIWHSALVTSLMLSVLLSSGLAGYLLDWPVMTLSWLSTLIFGLTVASGLMFTHYFVEPDLMHPHLRIALPICAIISVGLSALHAAFPFFARSVQVGIYTFAYVPILLVFLAALLDALRRGSHAAKYQAVGWCPMIIVGVVRIATGLLPNLPNNDAMLLFYFGCVFEVLSTAMGVAHQFMALKDQRDRAKRDAELMEYMAQRDALTGLFNRRALVDGFRDAVDRGYHKIAVLDIDHFKAVNDQYGHGTGDEVIRAAGAALQFDENVLAYRIGGEEFILLLRGPDADEQAERRRKAISHEVRQKVPHMERQVTASMGMAEIDSSDFAAAFERADRQLYSAKIYGRNRTQHEVSSAARPAVQSVEVAKQGAWNQYGMKPENVGAL